MLGQTNSSAGGSGGSDTFKAQLLLENVVLSGKPKTEDEIVAAALPVLQDIVGE